MDSTENKGKSQCLKALGLLVAFAVMVGCSVSRQGSTDRVICIGACIHENKGIVHSGDIEPVDDGA